jgi:hypothetical protein
LEDESPQQAPFGAQLNQLLKKNGHAK